MPFVYEFRAEVADFARPQFLDAGDSSVRKSWCDPTAFTEITGLDAGRGQVYMHSLYRQQDHDKFPAHQLCKRIALLPRGSLLVAEAAHLQTPQTQNSLSFLWTEEQLLDIYRACEANQLTLMLFPQYSTTRARKWVAANCPDGFVSADKSDDMNDARALAFYVRHRNGVALIKPTGSFCVKPKQLYARAVRSISNRTMNAERNIEYSGVRCPHVAKIAAELLMTVSCPFPFIENIQSAFALASTVCCEIDGVPVKFTYKGQSPGKNLWLHNVLGFSSCHHKGGIARSNIMWHRFRAFLAEYGRGCGVAMKDGPRVIPFEQHTEEQEAVLKAAKREMRQQLKVAYKTLLGLVAPFTAYEVLEHKEKVHGR